MRRVCKRDPLSESASAASECVCVWEVRAQVYGCVYTRTNFPYRRVGRGAVAEADAVTRGDAHSVCSGRLQRHVNLIGRSVGKAWDVHIRQNRGAGQSAATSGADDKGGDGVEGVDAHPLYARKGREGT